MNSSYIQSAQKAHQLPDFPWPEVALIGRSNCGKSSLLNALLSRRSLARVGQTPGRTQMVNFFALDLGDDRRLVFADLPGYGYSATGKEVRRHWEDLMAAYMARPQIRDFLFLMDVRRAGKLGEDDLDLIQFLSAGRKLTMVLTKIDKAKAPEIRNAQQMLASELDRHKIEVGRVIPVSALKKKGTDQLRAWLIERSFPNSI